jgi:S-(hydroxymethyl)glutathione dehydrogenase/alcohol dehydrogenase
VGPGVTKVKKKDFVVMHWMKGSGIHSATPLYYHQGTQINSGWITTFNEYAVVSENRITPIDGGSDPIVAALLGCIASTGIGVIVNEAKVQPFDTVLVYGCGGIGLCTIQAAHMVHPQQLIAIDINDQSLAKAKEFGATVVINAIKEDVLQRVRELTYGLGATKVLVTTGHPKAIENAIEATSIPGECILVGVPTKGEMVKIDPWSVMHKRSIKGTLGGDIWPDRDVPAYYHLFDGGHIPLDKLVTHISSFDQINEAIEVMRSKSPGRSIIKF